jgi:hypothetical protein
MHPVPNDVEFRASHEPMWFMAWCMGGILTERLWEVKKEIPERCFWDGYKWAKIEEVRRIIIPLECRHNGVPTHQRECSSIRKF